MEARTGCCPIESATERLPIQLRTDGPLGGVRFQLTAGALPLAIIFSAVRLALLRAVKLEAVVSIGFSYWRRRHTGSACHRSPVVERPIAVSCRG